MLKKCIECGNEFEVSSEKKNMKKMFCCKKCKDRYKVRKYRKEHPDYNKKKKREYYVKTRKKVIEILGGKCARCGIDDWRVLQINHLNGGGTKEFRNGHPEKIYRAIINGDRATDDLELRCANCNILYEYERGVRKDDDF